MNLAKLPKPPPWKSTTLTVPGGTTKEPIQFLYRDGLELFMFLFGNPVFRQHFQHKPTKIWADAAKKSRIIHGPMTGDLVWEIQVTVVCNPLVHSHSLNVRRERSKKRE